MKPISILAIALSCSIACNVPRKDATGGKDTIVMETDTIVKQKYSPSTKILATTYDSTGNVKSELQEEKSKIVYVSYNQYSFVSDPYDFSLHADSIEELLGEKAKTVVKEVEAGEHYSAYKYLTITFKETAVCSS